jgi:hypothetical protein
MSPTTRIKPLTERPAWKALAAITKKLQKLHLRKLFADDPTRGERLTVEAAGLYLDYSKNRVTDRTLKLLVQLAEESGLSSRIAAMFSGEKINVTETAPSCMWRCGPRMAQHRRGWEKCRARSSCCARQDGLLF